MEPGGLINDTESFRAEYSTVGWPGALDNEWTFNNLQLSPQVLQTLSLHHCLPHTEKLAEGQVGEDEGPFQAPLLLVAAWLSF